MFKGKFMLCFITIKKLNGETESFPCAQKERVGKGMTYIVYAKNINM